MAIACIIFSHQSKLLASSFDLPAIIVNFPFASTCYTNGPFLYVVFLTVTNLYPLLQVLFSTYVMFLLYVYTFTVCSCYVVLKVYLPFFDMLHLISGTNFLLHYVSLVLINLLHLHPLHYLHCHHPSHLHFFILS